MRARPITRRQSAANFKSGTRVNPRNQVRAMRGSPRL